jgi:hypothetical protein
MRIIDPKTVGSNTEEATSYNDIFDAFRLAMKFYRFEERDD